MLFRSHLPPVLKPVDDGVRPKRDFDDTWRAEADNKIQFICKTLFPCKNFITLKSSEMKERINECLYHMNKELK